VEERLFAGLADQAGLALRGARLRAQLEQRLVEVSARAEELRLSRQRLVEAQDRERRRLERDIHDGAQQHLVALAVNLSLASTLAVRSSDRANQVLADQELAAGEAIATIRGLSRGIYPSLLSDAGLEPALRAAVANSPVPVTVTSHGLQRYPASVEAAAYFCALEAFQNSLKHSGATAIRVEITAADERTLVVAVEDDGTGFDLARPGGTGLANMRDRVESMSGTLRSVAATGRGTRIEARLPLWETPAPSGV
jgi:signal transduction histidine kinase